MLSQEMFDFFLTTPSWVGWIAFEIICWSAVFFWASVAGLVVAEIAGMFE